MSEKRINEQNEGDIPPVPHEREALTAKEEDGDDKEKDSGKLPANVARFTVVNPNIHEGNGSPFLAKEAIVVHFDKKYMKTCDGIMRLVHSACALTAMICVVTSGTSRQHFMALPMHSELRIYLFVTVFGFMSSLLLLFVSVTKLYRSFPVNWVIMDLMLYFVCFFLFALGPSLVVQDIIRYHKHYPDVTNWTYQQLIISVLMGYICMIIAGYITYTSFRQYKGYGLFDRQRLQTVSTVET